MTPLLVRNQSANRAFERLYKAHVRDIYRYALMVTRNPDDAEDVVQTTFLKAFRAYERGQRPRSPRQWLITIAHNTCRSNFRDAKRRPQEVELEERLTLDTNAADADGVQPDELLRALGDLTFNQRSALVMRELEGRTYAEIAQVLELSPSAVETLLFRARRALREQLEGTLECGEAELAISRDLDGRLDRDERAQLRAHLRACKECAGLARRNRARRAALGALGPVQLPASLASWGGGAAVGAGIAAKVAAVVAAGAVAAGAGYEAADAVPEVVSPERASVVTVVTPRRAAALQASPARVVEVARRPVAAARPSSRRFRIDGRGDVTRERVSSSPAPAAPGVDTAAPAPAPSAPPPVVRTAVEEVSATVPLP
ncbi:MAG TPA: sigma-70 family RNA polymerase sigma factor, partial [Gaiellaceae bacterium]|nr:sigma-70 family RNA polymerase sigma factor [Gaiellaceae bacterium]